MEEEGYLLLVLHTHLPFVKDAEHAFTREESWLYEAVADCYIPLLSMLSNLADLKADFRIAFSLTPCLAEMFNDHVLQERCLRYMDERVELAHKEIRTQCRFPALLETAQWYSRKFAFCRRWYEERCSRDILSAFIRLRDTGTVSILASGATHAYFPLWEIFPHLVDFQVRLGVHHYKKHINRGGPAGFWLPECGYFTNVDTILYENGIRYFFLDKHGILNAHPRPGYGEYAPVHCPAGVAAFGRNGLVHDLVWVKDKGYSGDPLYSDFNSDLSNDRNEKYLGFFSRPAGNIKTGIKYGKNASGPGNGIFDPAAAFDRCNEQANHFIAACQSHIEYLRARLGKKPVIVALFDTELFGHWWMEGPIWLELMLKKLVFDQKKIRLISAEEYLANHPCNEVSMPSLSSWGYQGYSETWLMGRNHWIYPELYQAQESFQELLRRFPGPSGTVREALNQYLREFLQAQCSDWAFILHRETASDFAMNRIKTSIDNMSSVYRHLLHPESGDRQWLKHMQKKNDLFGDMDLLSIYEQSLRLGKS